MSPTARLRTFVVAAPLAFAALLMLHPMGDGDFYTVVSADTTAWLTVHLGAAVFFPLMACVIWLHVRRLPGRAASVARIAHIALPIFAAVYGLWEAIIGIASGVLTQEGNGATGEARRGIADAVNGLITHPIVGDPGVLTSIGSLAWITALSAAIVALGAAGVGRTPLILLGMSAVMVMHVPPIGPIALTCLSAAGFLLERERRSLAERRAPLRTVAPVAA